jgi:hypothetical protein
VIIAKVRCKCGNWIRLRAGASDYEQKTCWNCKPYSSKVEIVRRGGRPVGLVNGIVVPAYRLDIELDERN